VDINKTLEKLTGGEQLAVKFVRTVLDIYNSKDGAGLFKGVERYQVLAARLEIAAIQARNQFELWSLVLKRLQWPPPAMAHDAEVLELLQDEHAGELPGVIAKNASAIVMIARYWHTEVKKFRKEANAMPPMPEFEKKELF
jgi:hypothetical protein